MHKKTLKTLYKKLPAEIFCKSLNTSIRVTKAGFEHVFSQKARSAEEVAMRAQAIKHIPSLIRLLNLYQQHTRHYQTKGNTDYWNLQGVIDGVCIYVTLRKIGNQPIHLYSWHWKGMAPKIIKN